MHGSSIEIVSTALNSRVSVGLAMHSVQWVLWREPMLWPLAIWSHSVSRTSSTAQVHIHLFLHGIQCGYGNVSRYDNT